MEEEEQQQGGSKLGPALSAQLRIIYMAFSLKQLRWF